MNNSLYEIKKLQSIKSNFKLNINKFEIHRGAVYLFSGRIESGKSLMLNILSKEVLKTYPLLIILLKMSLDTFNFTWGLRLILSLMTKPILYQWL